jgi:putative phage-type endonuclease
MKTQALDKPHKPALRLVSTKAMSRKEWLKVRKQGIGASDASAAIGLNPYQSPLELWMIKTGRDAHLPEVDPNDEESPMYWGNILEPIVAEHYAKRTGRKVRKVNAVLQHPDNDKSWMLANLDYTVVNSDEVQILECKTAGEWGAKLWRDGVPVYIQCQVQHQLAVTGKQAADVCVLLCGQQINIFRIERNDDVIARIIELERRFWEFVTSDTPPPTDGSESSQLALQCLYPNDNAHVINLTHDEALCGDFDELLDVRERLERMNLQEAKLKQRIQAAMGDYSKAMFINGEVSWKRSKDSIGLNTKALLEEQPELLDAFPQIRLGSRRFVIHT